MKNKGVNNNTLDKSAIIIGLIFMTYYIGLKLTLGTIAFAIVFFLVGLGLVIFGVLEIKFKISFWNILPKVLRKIIVVLFFIGLCVFISIEGLILYEGHHKDKEKTDYLMVLGAGVRGEEITKTLKFRLDTAIEFNKENPNTKIVVSGGQGEGEDVTEAFAMKKYLVENGVKEDLIISEDKSTNTYENFIFTKEILDKENKDYKITVVTNDFHMYRAKYLAKQVGIEAFAYPASSPISTTLNFHVREFFGVIKAYIFKR